MKTYRYRFYPNKEQREQLAQTFGCARYVYNWGLRLRTDAYHGEGKHITYVDSAKELTQHKKEEDRSWLNGVSSVVLQQSLRNLERAFQNFFDGRTQYPTFKRKHSKQTATYANSAFTFDGKSLTLAKQKTPLKIKWSRKPEGSVVKVTVALDSSGRYHVCLHCRTNTEPLPATDKSVGVDVGISDVATCSDGFKSGSPKHYQKDLRKIQKASRVLSRRQKGSNRYYKQKKKVAKIHARIADRRSDFLHKLTTKIIRENQTIALESLSVKNMMRNHSLAQSIGDASWGELVRQLEYKAEWYGREIIKIDRWFPSSKRCSACGHVRETLPLGIRDWICPECGVHHDRDVNAAVNILAVGQTVQARGPLGKSSSSFEMVGSTG